MAIAAALRRAGYAGANTIRCFLIRSFFVSGASVIQTAGYFRPPWAPWFRDRPPLSWPRGRICIACRDRCARSAALCACTHTGKQAAPSVIEALLLHTYLQYSLRFRTVTGSDCEPPPKTFLSGLSLTRARWPVAAGCLSPSGTIVFPAITLRSHSGDPHGLAPPSGAGQGFCSCSSILMVVRNKLYPINVVDSVNLALPARGKPPDSRRLAAPASRLLSQLPAWH